MEKNYTDINAKAIDNWAENGWEWGIPISHEEYLLACSGELKVYLTPSITVPVDWFSPYFKNGKFTNTKLLGLASGGGQQMPIFSALGADCTVLDYSDKQLESEKIVAQRENYKINIVKSDMTKRLPFDDNSFDIIFHPVSNCFIENVYHVWNECFRVLKKGGILLAGMDNGINFLFDDFNEPLILKNKLPVNPLKNPTEYDKLATSNEGIQFSHTMEEQIGGQLKAGLTLKELYEDVDKEGELGKYFPEYIATKSIK